MTSEQFIANTTVHSMPDSLSKWSKDIGAFLMYCIPIILKIESLTDLLITQQLDIETIKKIVSCIELFLEETRNILYIKNELEIIIKDYTLQKLLAEIVII